jgi:opacity protein-like surface antigen
MNRFRGLTLVIMLFSVCVSFAQEEESKNYISKGQWMAGGKLSLSKADDVDYLSFAVSPMGGYFLGKKIAVGLQTGYTHSNFFNTDGSNAGSYNNLSVSPFVRYYINTNRIAPFAEVMGGNNWSTSKSDYLGTETTFKRSIYYYAAGIGLNYFISRDVALEGILRYNDTEGDNKAYLDFDLGLQFFLSRNNKSEADAEGNYFSKGQWLIGGTGNLSLGALDDVGLHQFSISPMAGYLVGKKIAVGLSTGYIYSNINNTNTDSFFAGPFVRYYLTQKKLAPYAEVAYGASWTRIENTNPMTNEVTTYKDSGSSYRIGAGLNYFISKNVALDANLRYSRNSDWDTGSTSLNVGLQFFIR